MHMFLGGRKRIYLDYAAATPVRKEVRQAMEPYFGAVYGNPSAIHAEGVAARTAVEGARGAIAKVLRIRPQGVVFTASGTESNNLAVYGAVQAKYKEGVPHKDMEVISSKIEHPSVYEALEEIARRGVTVKYASVDSEGLVDVQHFESLLSPKTVLVTFAYVNSEIGVTQHIGKIARIVRAYEKKHRVRICVHTDASQAPLWLSCALDHLSVDALSLDAGKCYGPKGVGVLAFRQGTVFAPTILGGSQEFGLRAGTENTPLIVGCCRALEIAQAEYEKRSARVRVLRDAFIEKLKGIERVVLNGSQTNRVANNVNISIPGIDSEFAVITLDEEGIACSTKSACGGANGTGSAVVRIVTGDERRATSAIRFTLGEDTTLQELTKAVLVLKKHIEQTRVFS